MEIEEILKNWRELMDYEQEYVYTKTNIKDFAKYYYSIKQYSGTTSRVDICDKEETTNERLTTVEDRLLWLKIELHNIKQRLNNNDKEGQMNRIVMRLDVLEQESKRGFQCYVRGCVNVKYGGTYMSEDYCGTHLPNLT